MSITLTRRTAAVSSLVALALSAGTTDVLGSTPGWKLAATVHGVVFDGIAVTSAKDAWAVGSRRGSWNPWVSHWNGRTWTAVTLPAAANGAILNSVSASSGTNVWVGGTDLAGSQYILHWDGKHWRVTVTKVSASGPVVLTLGTKDVWTFAWRAGFSSTSDTRHFNGSRWSSVKNPGQVNSVSAVSGGDIWAAGSKNALTGVAPAVLRWDGKVWRLTKAPAVTDSRAEVTSILARKDTDVWVTGHEAPVPSASPQTPPLAFHWNGKSWTDLAPPQSAGWLNSVTDDGAGGVWAIGFQNRLYHYTAGKWTSTGVPITQSSYGVEQLARTPGTTALWGVGWTEHSGFTGDGLIFRHGG